MDVKLLRRPRKLFAVDREKSSLVGMIAAVLVLGGSLAVWGGTPCPDPATPRQAGGCWGQWVGTGNIKGCFQDVDGGCFTPGHSSMQCLTASDQVDVINTYSTSSCWTQEDALPYPLVTGSCTSTSTKPGTKGFSSEHTPCSYD